MNIRNLKGLMIRNPSQPSTTVVNAPIRCVVTHRRIRNPQNNNQDNRNTRQMVSNNAAHLSSNAVVHNNISNINNITQNVEISNSRPSNSNEINRINRRIGNFDWEKSLVWQYLQAKYGPKLNHEELISIALLLANKLHLHLDRDARRRKCVLIKWFEENWVIFSPFIGLIVLENS